VTLGIDLGGRTCLVVGGAGGRIGSAIVTAVAEAGASVGIITRNGPDAERTVEELRGRGTRASAAVADVEDEAALVDAVARVGSELGSIRHLVNVIGGAMGEYHAGAELSLAAIDKVLDRNLRYAVVACREVGAGLLARGETGSIVNVSSPAALGRAMLAAYSVAKAGLDAYSRSIALEWAPQGIRVNVIGCGAIRTGDQPRGVEQPTVPLRRRGEPEDVAHAAAFLLSDLASYTTGATLYVDGGSNLGSSGGSGISSMANQGR
jgi:NAD(P)-dependent dehydrogenase (short-subunit alcohol dehydrogenase family)